MHSLHIDSADLNTCKVDYRESSETIARTGAAALDDASRVGSVENYRSDVQDLTRHDSSASS